MGGYSFDRKEDNVDDAMAADINELQQAIEAFQYLKLEAASELAISSGAITVTRSAHKLQPESGTEDDLDTIDDLAAGELLILYVSDAGTDTIMIKHGTGNISCPGESDIEFSTGVVICFSPDGTNVYVSGGGGGGGSSSKSERLWASPAISALTISGGEITVGEDGWYKLKGEGSADDVLATINGGEAGAMIILSLNNADHEITLDHDADNIQLSSGQDKVLFDTYSNIVLACDGIDWIEVASNVQMVLLGFLVDGGGVALTTSATPVEWPWAPPFYLMGIYSSASASGDGDMDILYGSVLAEPTTLLTAWDHASEQYKSDTTLSGLTREFSSPSSWRVAVTDDFTAATWVSLVLWGWRR